MSNRGHSKKDIPLPHGRTPRINVHLDSYFRSLYNEMNSSTVYLSPSKSSFLHLHLHHCPPSNFCFITKRYSRSHARDMVSSERKMKSTKEPLATKKMDISPPFGFSCSPSKTPKQSLAKLRRSCNILRLYSCIRWLKLEALAGGDG